MDKRVMLAVAGSGKTYTLCNSINENERNLILAYTNENIHNIFNELLKRYTYIPEKTEVMTFDKFIYQYIICPYEPTIRQYFNELDFKRKGITILDPPKPSFVIGNIRRKNPDYHTQEKLAHYHKEGKYYCSLLSKLIMKVKKRPNNLAKKAKMNQDDRVNRYNDFMKSISKMNTSVAAWKDTYSVVLEIYSCNIELNQLKKEISNCSDNLVKIAKHYICRADTTKATDEINDIVIKTSTAIDEYIRMLLKEIDTLY